MIVICTKCQAKFRVADDKIGPRGAKVRCSKCQTVFLVHPVLGTVPVTDGDARHVARPAPPPVPAPAAAPAREPAADPFTPGDPFAAPPPATDPFGPPRDDPFAPPASPAADPFGGADPFAAAPPPAASAGGLGDPFVAAVSHRSTLPVTDLSDLMGAPAAAGPPPLPSARAAPAPDPFSAPVPAPPPAAPEPAAEPPAPEAAFAAPPPAAPEPALADPFASEDPFAAAAAAPPPLPGAAGEPSGPAQAEAEPDLELAAPTGGQSLDDGGLALEDRLTPTPSRIATPSSAAPLPDPTLETAAPAPAGGGGPDPFAAFGAAPAGGAAEPFDPGAFDFGGAGAGDLGGPEPGLAEPPPAAAAPPPRPAPAPDPGRPSAAGAPPAAIASSTPSLAGGEAADRIPGARTSRLRTVAVNAIALFAVIVVALAIWAVWRTDGPLEAASLRPSAILAALGRGGASGAWTAQDVRSGVYDRVRGAPLLFVRGRVVSRATTAVPRLKVAVQVVRGGQVLARGEALAGAVPTEEDLYLAADDAAIAAVRRAAEARAPAAVRPGDAVPFLVAIGDAPPDLQGATLRIDVGPAGGAAP